MVSQVSEKSQRSAKSLPPTALSNSNDGDISQVPTAQENSTRTAIGGTESLTNTDVADNSIADKLPTSVKTVKSNDSVAKSPSGSMRTAMVPKTPEVVLSNLRKGNLFGSSKKVRQSSQTGFRSGPSTTPPRPDFNSDTAMTSLATAESDTAKVSTAKTGTETTTSSTSRHTTSSTSNLSAKSPANSLNRPPLQTSTMAQKKETSANRGLRVTTPTTTQKSMTTSTAASNSSVRSTYLPLHGVYGTEGQPADGQTKSAYLGSSNNSSVRSSYLPVVPSHGGQGRYVQKADNSARETRPGGDDDKSMQMHKVRTNDKSSRLMPRKSTSKSNGRDKKSTASTPPPTTTPPRDTMGNSVSMHRGGRARASDVSNKSVRLTDVRYSPSGNRLAQSATSPEPSSANSYKIYNKTTNKNSMYLPLVPSHNTNAQMNQPKDINLNSLCVYDISKVPAWQRRIQPPPPSVNNPPLLTTLDENAGRTTRSNSAINSKQTALSGSSTSVTGTTETKTESSVATVQSEPKTVVIYGTTPDGKNKVEFTVQMRIIAGEALGRSQTPVDLVPNKIVVGGNPVWTPESDKKQ